VYYGNSKLLTEVQYYPLVQLLVVATICYSCLYHWLLFKINPQQNQVWAGMAKETATPDGHPFKQFAGWLEMLKMEPVNQPYIQILKRIFQGWCLFQIVWKMEAHRNWILHPCFRLLKI
jgi:hypothetical protein